MDKVQNPSNSEIHFCSAFSNQQQSTEQNIDFVSKVTQSVAVTYKYVWPITLKSLKELDINLNLLWCP
jgi:hypothetical protein